MSCGKAANRMKHVTNAMNACATVGVLLTLSGVAHAGSNNDSLEANSTLSCDNRALMSENFDSWCTLTNARAIRSSCYAVIHAEPVQRCGWQGCGHISFVGQKATIAGNNVKEYGITTPHNLAQIPSSWQPTGNSVLPKAPFPRVYLTVDQFVTVKENCAKNHNFVDASSASRICEATEQILDLNPYYFCLRHHKLIP